MRGDRVEIVIDAGGQAKTYEVTATKAGRRVEVVIRRGLVEVNELTRGGTVVRTARFMTSRVLALVEHPAPRQSATPTVSGASAPADLAGQSGLAGQSSLTGPARRAARR